MLLTAAALLAACAGGDEPIVVQLSVEPRPTPTRTPMPIPAITNSRPLAALPTPSYEGWLPYLNEVYRYQFLYPPEASIREARQDAFGSSGVSSSASLHAQYTGQICVTVELAHSFVAIAAPPNRTARLVKCGETDFAPYDIVGLQEQVTVGGKVIATQGYEFLGPDETLLRHFEWHLVRLADGMDVAYGSLRDRKGTFADYLAEKPAVFQIMQSIVPLEVASVSRPDFASLPPVTEPIFTGEGLVLDSWSPDGNILSISEGRWSDGLKQYVVDFHFYDIHTADRCTYAHNNAAGLDFRDFRVSPRLWLAGGRFLTHDTQGALVVLADPCNLTITPLASFFPEPIAGISAAGTAGEALLMHGESSNWLFNPETGVVREIKALAGKSAYQASFSPEAGFLLFDEGAGDFYLINVSSGELVGVVSRATYAELGPAEARWISEDRFILSNRRPGPALVTFTPEGIQEIQPMASTFFGLPDMSTNSAFGIANENDFHLLCCWEYGGLLLPRALLYHSETETVEALPGQFRSFWGNDFAPGGDVLILRADRILGGTHHTEVWLRPLDPPGSEPQLFVTAEDESSLNLSPDGKLIAVMTSLEYAPVAVVSVYSVPDGSVRARWNLGDYRDFGLIWSPASSHLAGVGSTDGGRERALFILPMPED